MKLKSTSLLVAGALFGAAVMPAHAGNEAMMDLLKVLRDKGTISAQDYDMLKNAAAADSEIAEAEKAEIKKEVEEATANMPNITTDGKLVVADKEGNWEFQPIGRVMWDAIDADADDLAEDAQGTELRRARLGFQGSIYDWGYKFEADFAGGDASIKDAYLGYGNKLSDNVKWGVKLGQSHIPFGLNTKISSKYMSFMDRPLFADTDWSPARQSGVVAGINDSDYKWTLSAGLTNGGLSGGETTDNGSTFAARASFVPYMASSTQLIQIGAGYLTRGGGDGFDDDQRVVSHIDNTKPIDLVVASSDDDGSDAFTVDAMAIFGSFHAMAEYLDYTNDTTAGDIDTTGYAIEAGYFLTGESLKWKKGYTSGISPKSKYGAWQVAARFENMEVDQIAGNATSGDEADKFSLGINYYPTKNTRLMLNYDKVTDLTINGISRDEEPSALKFRAQAYW
ncbi:porin [Methylophaga sp.]|uniref:OprO/OprP family phosphate-selective porin n=1 Tax=Methylophaga sp. TaxID=2024840 RepID=UPI001400517F|nr:porin [Methylophaga sp.]MTI62777.1 porin [Methylophaga sp.]